MSSELLPSDHPYWNQPRWLHPISLLFEVAANIRQQIIPSVLALVTATQWGLFGLGMACLVFAIAMAVAIFRYLTLRYQMLDDELIINQGWIFKQHRTIPIARIQNIDLVQNLLHRFFGVAEVRIETASGSEAEATLRVLSLQDVNKLRSRIFDQRSVTSAAGTASLSNTTDLPPVSLPDPSGEVTPSLTEANLGVSAAAAKHEILTISLRELFWAGLISNRGWVILALAIGAIWKFEPWEGKGVVRQFSNFWNWAFGGLMNQGWNVVLYAIPLFFLAFLLLRFFSVLWHITQFYGYRLQRVGEDLRIECGLFTKRSATIPRQRIQFISIHRSFLARPLGLASIRLETASRSQGGEDGPINIAHRWFVPVLPESKVADLIAELRPGLVWKEKELPWQPLSPKAGARIRKLGLLMAVLLFLGIVWFQWIIAVVTGIAFACYAVWYAKKKAAATRYARTEWGLVYRSGMFTKKCSMTFMDKIQSVSVSHSPFDRRWKMAVLAVDTAAAGAADHAIQIEMLDFPFAFQERDAIAAAASLIDGASSPTEELLWYEK